MPSSPWRRIPLASIATGLMAQPIRLDRMCHRQLGTSHGCQDHTVLPYASSAAHLAHRLPLMRFNSPCDHPVRRRPRVHHIPPRVRDDRDTPLLSSRDSRKEPLIWGEGEAEYICNRVWTTQIRLNLFDKLNFSRSGFSAAMRTDERAGHLVCPAQCLGLKFQIVSQPIE